MKKKAALILSLIMLLMVMMPMQSYADIDKGLEDAVKTARYFFDIPEDFRFDYNIGTNNDKTEWHMNWRDEDDMEGNISVTVDEDGTIINYYKGKPYKPDDYLKRNRFPKVSKAEAKSIAEDFIKRVNPEAISNVKYQDNQQSRLGDMSYYLEFVRVINDIPFYSNNISVSVDRETGEVLSYYYNWYDAAEFSSPEDIMTVEEAEDAYKKNMGVSLIYKYSMINEEMNIYAVYTPDYNNSAYGIDAFTGEKVQTDGYYHTYTTSEEKMMLKDEAAGLGIRLSPEELEAVNKASEFITPEEAEKIARNLDVLELDDSLKLLNGPSLSRSWPDREQFEYYMNFTREPDDKDSEYRNVNVTVNAITGEIMNFYLNRWYPDEGEQKAKYSMEESKAEAEKFLKEFKPEKFEQTEYFDIYNTDYSTIRGNIEQRYYSFRYTRKVNGKAFPSNGLSVSFDAVTGNIRSFSMDWYDKKFKELDNTIPTEDAYERLFDEIGLELQYKIKHTESDRLAEKSVAIVDNSKYAPETQLVYVLKSGKPYDIDAFSGELLDGSGGKYEEMIAPNYSDIASCFAKNEITALAEYGIYLEGSEFKPAQSIKQKDFFILLSKTLLNYYEPLITSDSTEKQVNEMYNNLIRLGILNENEKAPYSTVTREDSIKFVIRALNYDEVAEIKGIYKDMYKDQNNINPDLAGYIAIASGLNIIKGNDGYFSPKNDLTRAEAAVIIYNYLQR